MKTEVTMRLGHWVFSSRRMVTSSISSRRSSAGSVPKPWTGDSEAPVTESGVRPRYDTRVDVSRP